MTPAERVTVLLDGVRPTGQGRWMAKCPAHDDKSPSLSIRETSDGALLVHCFSGCNTSDVMAALGLSLSDLFDNPPWERGPNRRQERGLAASEKLKMIASDSWVVLIAAEHISRGDQLCDDDRNSLYAAVARIQTVCGASR